MIPRCFVLPASPSPGHHPRAVPQGPKAPVRDGLESLGSLALPEEEPRARKKKPPRFYLWSGRPSSAWGDIDI